MPLEILPGEGYLPGHRSPGIGEEVRQFVSVWVPRMETATIHYEQIRVELRCQPLDKALPVVLRGPGCSKQIVNAGCLAQSPRFFEQGGLGDRTGDGDEGQGIGDAEQGQRQFVAGLKEFLGERRCVHLLADGQSTRTTVHEGFGQRHLALRVGGYGQAIGHHEFTACDPFPQLGQVGRVRPGDAVVEARGSGQERKAELRFVYEFSHGNCHSDALQFPCSCGDGADSEPFRHSSKRLRHL